jgi:ribosome-binding factor A
MPYLMVRLKVRDFPQWKRVFDSHAEAQRQFGLRLEKVVRNLDDPNEVVTWFEVTDLAKARVFVSSLEVPRAQEDSGVVDTPDIYFLG